MIAFRKQYRRDKNAENLNLVKMSSTKYKKVVHRTYFEFKKKLISTKTPTENPNEYWENY